MSNDRVQIIAKLHQDHVYMAELIKRIRLICDSGSPDEDCHQCDPGRRIPCHMNIEHLIRTLVEVTIRHNLIESACMEEGVPREHRIAHNRAHLDISETMRSIRLDFKENGDGIVAIEQISSVLDQLDAHLANFNRAMEQFLLEA